MTEHAHRQSWFNPRPWRPSRVTEVIETKVLRGEGCCEEDLAREAIVYFDLEGNFLAEHDPVRNAIEASQLDACREAYLNNTTERDMLEVAYKDLRSVVKHVMDDPALPPNLLTRLEAVYSNGEVKPA